MSCRRAQGLFHTKRKIMLSSSALGHTRTKTVKRRKDKMEKIKLNLGDKQRWQELNAKKRERARHGNNRKEK